MRVNVEKISIIDRYIEKKSDYRKKRVRFFPEEFQRLCSVARIKIISIRRKVKGRHDSSGMTENGKQIIYFEFTFDLISEYA